MSPLRGLACSVPIDYLHRLGRQPRTGFQAGSADSRRIRSIKVGLLPSELDNKALDSITHCAAKSNVSRVVRGPISSKGSLQVENRSMKVAPSRTQSHPVKPCHLCFSVYRFFTNRPGTA